MARYMQKVVGFYDTGEFDPAPDSLLGRAYVAPPVQPVTPPSNTPEDKKPTDTQPTGGNTGGGNNGGGNNGGGNNKPNPKKTP